MNNEIKNTAIALAIALPLLTIGFIGKADKPVRLADCTHTSAATTVESASAPNVDISKDESSETNEPSEKSLEMDEHARSCISTTDFLLLADLTTQRVGVYHSQKDEWEQVQYYPCSSSALGSQTPTGKFRIQNRGTWFYNKSLGENLTV